MSTATVSHSNSIALSVAVAAFVAAVAFTGVTIAEHHSDSTSPATTDHQVTYPVYTIPRPWHSGIQPGMP
jgi:hypothetical protein